MSRQRQVVFVNWMITGCLVLLTIYPAQSQHTSGKKIYDQLLRVYANTHTYQDKGRVQTFFYKLDQKTPYLKTVRNFTTAYNRQIHTFRFWYKTEKATASSLHEEMVIWSRDNDSHLCWTLSNPVDQKIPLIEALGTATGVSGTASRKVPGLLFPDSIGAGWGIESLKNVKLIGTDVQDKRRATALPAFSGKIG